MKFILTSNSYDVIESWSTTFGILPKKMTVAFIDTAAHMKGKPSPTWLAEDRDALTNIGFTVTDYTLIDKTREQLITDLLKFDIIFVSGGNTFYLLEHANRSGFCDLIREDYFHDKIYVGSSAGSVLLSHDIDAIKYLDDPSVANLENTKAIGICNFVIFPHWGSDQFKTQYQKTMPYVYEKKDSFFTLPDNSYILYENVGFKYIAV